MVIFFVQNFRMLLSMDIRFYLFGSKREEVTEERRKVQKLLRNMYPSPNIIRVIKSNTRLMVLVAYIEYTKIASARV